MLLLFLVVSCNCMTILILDLRYYSLHLMLLNIFFANNCVRSFFNSTFHRGQERWYTRGLHGLLYCYVTYVSWHFLRVNVRQSPQLALEHISVSIGESLKWSLRTVFERGRESTLNTLTCFGPTLLVPFQVEMFQIVSSKR